MGWLAGGSRVGDRYRLIERLGTGGMSVVWRGHDEILGRAVAVKVLSPQLAADSTFRDRLRQEALAAARLSHPHITGIFDFGESPIGAHLTVPYVVMELNDGESVSARLRRDGPFPWHDAVAIVADVASALATAHDRGVVHRDVTPANVMLTATGAKVVDFGISALIGQRDAAPDGSLLGTPAYLAPERLGGGQVSPPADVYALGLLLYRMLTGRFPWPAGNTTEALRAHLYAEPEPVPALPGLPRAVADLCLRCLAKPPEDRPTATEAAEVLSALIGWQPVVAPAASPRPSPRPRRPARAPGLRLRAALRLSRALRIGGPKALGGGLFKGGALTWDLLAGGRLGEAVVAGRHRLQAGMATLVLAATIGLIWSSAREPADVGTAQAAAAGTAAGAIVPHGTGCKVRYRVKHDSGTDFGAQVTIINTGEHVLSQWRLEFAFTGGQRLTESPKRLTQKGRKLVLRAKAGTALRPGRSATVTLSGSYRVNNPLPLVFALNGHQCQAEVLGAVVMPPVPVPVPAASPSSSPAAVPPPPSPSAPGAARKAEPNRPAETPATRAPAPKKSKPKAVEPRSGFAVTV